VSMASRLVRLFVFGGTSDVTVLVLLLLFLFALNFFTFYCKNNDCIYELTY